MGRLHYCLGVSASVQNESEKSLLLYQKQYFQNILQRYGLTKVKITSTPADLSVKLEKDDRFSKEVDPIIYQSMVGSLLYVKVQLKANRSAPLDSCKVDLQVPETQRIRHSSSDNTKFEALSVVGYSDVDWAGFQDDRHSTSGDIF